MKRSPSEKLKLLRVLLREQLREQTATAKNRTASTYISDHNRTRPAVCDFSNCWA